MNTLNFFLTLDDDASRHRRQDRAAATPTSTAAARTPTPIRPTTRSSTRSSRASVTSCSRPLPGSMRTSSASTSSRTRLTSTRSRTSSPGLNEMDGVGPYAAIDTGPIGTDAIKVGLIYNPDVGHAGRRQFQILSSADDPRFVDTREPAGARPDIRRDRDGARFTVVVNHLKSKGDSGLAAPRRTRASWHRRRSRQRCPRCDGSMGSCNGTRLAPWPRRRSSTGSRRIRRGVAIPTS